MSTKQEKGKFFYAVSLGSELGFMIALPLVLFLFLGVYLDKKFETLPIFIITFTVLSIVFTFFELRYFILPFLEKRSKKKNSPIGEKDNKK